MRTEKEMYDLILSVAKNDKRVKAVYMNGSRTNENVPKDMFQDYDIVYVVEETESFQQDKKWIQIFGEILYMQYPEEDPFFICDKENFYGWLMQFADGVRIDLHVETVEHARQHIGDDKLCKVLLDEEHILPPVEAATDRQHWIQRPLEEQFLAVCNEFWWCTNNVAKGLWREEMPYVQDAANNVRAQLITMLNWKTGLLTGWSVSTGKSSKYLYRWLSEEEWQAFLSTYFDCDISRAWQAVFRMCDLFEETAQYAAAQLGYAYNSAEGASARSFLERTRRLPKKEGAR